MMACKGPSHQISCLLILSLFVWLSFVGSTSQIQAQSVHPDVFLDRSTATTFTKLDQLRTKGRPQIGLFYSRRTILMDDALGPDVEEAIRLWELFLVGMELPYRVMEDTSLYRPIDDDIRLLIMPGVEVLSEQQRSTIKNYLERGGGMIASGRTGFLDDRGVLQNDRFFKEIFGAEPSIDLPDSLNGLFQSLEGGHAPTNGIAPGFLLNVSRPAYGMAVLPLQSQSLGPLVAYERMGMKLVEEALHVSTLLLKGEYGGGRFVWLGFNPQDVSLEEEQQAVYQGLILNAMAHVARIPTLSVRRWPHGFTSASGFAVLPTLGYQPYAYRSGMDLVLSALENAKVKATFFMVTSRANDHPDVLDRIVAQGELALTSDTDEMLAKQSRDLQYHRIRAAKNALQQFSSPIKGFYPPGGFYDPNTLRVLIDMELDYMLSDARTLNVPVFLRWEDELDYRDSLLTTQPVQGPMDVGLNTVEGVQSTPQNHEVITLYPSLFSYALDDRSGLEGSAGMAKTWVSEMEKSFEEQHDAEGLFLFAFEPETMGLTQQRAEVLETFGRHIRTQNTWIATLGDLAEWWHDRRQVVAEIDSIDEGGYTLLVHNNTDEEIRGVSLDFALNMAAHRILDLETSTLDVWTKRDLEKMLLVIETLPVGTHRIRLQNPSIITSDVSEEIAN